SRGSLGAFRRTSATRSKPGFCREGQVVELKRAVEKCARPLDVHRHLREHALHQWLLSHGLSELLALVGVGGGVVERGFGDPERLGRDPKPRIVHELEHRTEALALLAQPVTHRTLEYHLAGR